MKVTGSVTKFVPNTQTVATKAPLPNMIVLLAELI